MWFKRKPGMSVDAFREHWRGEHARKVARLPGLRRYVQNHAHGISYRDGREPWVDGFAETWFDDTDAMRRVAASAEYAAVVEDEANFLDLASRTELLVDEVVVKGAPAPPGAVKYAVWVNMDPALHDVDGFQRYWRDVHGPLGAANPHLVRYVQNHVRRRAYDAGRVPPFDGVTMTWSRDLDDLRASARSEELRRVVEDQVHFMANPGGELPTLIVEEHEVALG